MPPFIHKLACSSAATLLALLMAQMTARATEGPVFYLAPDGGDQNAGSEEHPWKTLKHALSRGRPGSVIVLKEGTYRGAQIDDVHGTEAHPITLRGVDAEKCIVDGSLEREDEYRGGRDAIWFNRCSHVVLENVSLVDAQRAGVLVVRSHHVTVRRCIVRDNGSWGLFTNHSPHVTFEENDISGSKKQHGIYFANGGSDHPVARANVIHDNRQCGIHTNGDPDAGGDGIISDALIERNVIYRNGKGGGSAINMTFVHDSVVRNNLCYGNHAGGIVVYRDKDKAPDKFSKGVRILNNTVYFEPSRGRWACAVQNRSRGITIMNNVFYGGRYGAFAVGPACRRQLSSNRNVVFNHPRQRIVGDSDRRWYYTIEEWRQEGYDNDSSFEDPMFVNVQKDDFRLKTGSPGAGLGVRREDVTRDITGEKRPDDNITAGCHQALAEEPT